MGRITYKIEGNKLIRRDVGHYNPDIQGRLYTELFRIEGGTLIISNLRGKTPAGSSAPSRRNRKSGELGIIYKADY